MFTGPNVKASATDGEEVRQILRLLELNGEYSISNFHPQLVVAGILNRMSSQTIPTVAEYLIRLDSTPEELIQLREVLLTTKSLAVENAKIDWSNLLTELNQMIAIKENGQPLRIWIPGCGIGIKAYFVAVTTLQLLENKDSKPIPKVFATDINVKALSVGVSGRYEPSLADSIPLPYLQKYFIKGREQYVATKSIRELITFAKQDVRVAPPFAEIDLLWAEHLLELYQPSAVRQITTGFIAALGRKGRLVLGKPQPAGLLPPQLKLLDAKHGIYCLHE